MTETPSPVRQRQGRLIEGVYTVEVGVSMRRPLRLDEWRKIVVYARSGDEAELLAQQIASCGSVMAIESVVIDWPESLACTTETC